MPRIKVDYVVSFSSEDSEHPASTLLATDISKKKWLGANKGEACNSIVLQLAKSSLISSLNIGTYDTAIVEVLVGRSETPNDQFKVLMVSSIFMTPMESRKGEGITKVRSFSTDQLQVDVRGQKWDRVRVICKQPFNKHVKYGLSFIHFFESDSSANPTAPDQESVPTMVPESSSLMANRFQLGAQSSDEDDAFKPGELFASMKESSQSTESQIRQAGSSKVLKNIAESQSSTLLVKTPISKDKTKSSTPKLHNDDTPRSRDRNSLLYKNDDEKPNAKIDKVIARDREEKAKEKAKEEARKLKDNVKKDKPAKLDSSPAPSKASNLPSNSDYRRKDKPSSSKEDTGRSVNLNKTPDGHRKEDQKRRHSGDRTDVKKKAKVEMQSSADPYTLMRDVVFVMSGYVNPQRSSMRDKALAMGAKCKREWESGCTHLICAFANTPKMKQVRSSGGDAVIVTGKWIEECCEKKRRLPWQWFATEPGRRVARPPSPDVGDASPPSDARSDRGGHSDEDTDDEINRIQNRIKNNATPTKQAATTKQKDSPVTSSTKVTPNGIGKSKDEHDSDATDVGDDSVEVIEPKVERHTVVDSSSETDNETDVDESLNKQKEDEQLTSQQLLPDFFTDMCFVIDPQVEEDGFDIKFLKRYITAYNGSVLQDPSDDSEVDIVLSLDKDCDGARQFVSAQVISPEWVWKCSDEGTKVSPLKYSVR